MCRSLPSLDHDTPNLMKIGEENNLGASLSPLTLAAVVRVQAVRGDCVLTVCRSRGKGCTHLAPWLLSSVTLIRSAQACQQDSINAFANQTQSPFLLYEQPTTSLARPPVVVQIKAPHHSHCTAVYECEKMVEISLHCLQITSIKKELGVCTNLLSLCKCSSWV